MTNSRNICLTISYDGTDFSGWQRQDTKTGQKIQRTVQEEIEKALFKIHKQKTTLYGSGRTDSGVHAFGQVANFYSPINSIPAQKYVNALNAFLPQDIRILESKEVPESFNSRFSATSRVYRYFISYKNNNHSANMRYSWYVKNYEPNLQKLNQLASCLRGELDCSSFAYSKDESLSPNRYIDNAHFFIQKDLFNNDLLVFEIQANAFLWKMVRTITGTLINLDKEKKSDDSMLKILQSKDRKKAGVTAPPNGLFLYKIYFDGIRRHV